MKKILLIILILFLTGCYDYNELTDLAIVSSMVIDYKKDEYVVNLEILETKKEVSKTSYFVQGKGKTFEEALVNIYSKSSKHIYYNHIFAIILSKSIAENHLDDIYDFFLIQNDVRKDSVFVISDDVDKLLSFKTEDKMSIGEAIKNIFNYSEIENGNYRTVNFREILNCYLNKKNYYLSSISIDKNVIALSSVYLISNDKLSQQLEAKSVLFANLLDARVSSFIISLDDEVFEVYKNKLTMDITKNKIAFSLKADVRLYGKSNNNISKKENVEKIENKISKYLNEFIKNALKYSIGEELDIYNLDYYYYQKYPDDAYQGVFENLEYGISSSVTFNEKGFLLSQIGEKKNGR